MLCFVVAALLRRIGRASESVKNLLLIDLLDVRLTGQGVFNKSLAVIVGKRPMIGQKPRFHHLNHQLNLVFVGLYGALPFVAAWPVEMLPWGRVNGDL